MVNAAVRILREEVWWLTEARKKARRDLNNPSVPAHMVVRQIAQIEREIDDIEVALFVLDCEGETMVHPGQMELWA